MPHLVAFLISPLIGLLIDKKAHRVTIMLAAGIMIAILHFINVIDAQIKFCILLSTVIVFSFVFPFFLYH